MMGIRDFAGSDLEAIRRINEAHVQQTSPMDGDRLTALARMSAYFKVAIVDGQIAAFLIAMREQAAYENENHNFVVDTRFAGSGMGSSLYGDLFAFARSQGIVTITCEYNLQPPNPASRAFHDKCGFKELDTQWVAGGAKKVSLQAATLTGPGARTPVDEEL